MSLQLGIVSECIDKISFLLQQIYSCLDLLIFVKENATLYEFAWSLLKKTKPLVSKT